VTEDDRADFAARYGPWALSPASEGVARRSPGVSPSRVNVVPLARRQHVLDEVAASIASATGVEVRTLAVDLAEDGAMASIAAGTQDLEVGLLMYCAGADPSYRPFLAEPVESALSMVQRNCPAGRAVPPLRRPHGRSRCGGIVLVSSGGGLVGAPNMVAYGASKAFDMVMAEALWAELHDQGVDVLGLVLGLTDTPALRRLLVQRGELADFDAPLPSATPDEVVAADAIANLANGPTWLAGEDVRMGFEHLGAMPRNDAVRLMISVAGEAMGSDARKEMTQ
jgi:short-subunit dehydrogenase